MSSNKIVNKQKNVNDEEYDFCHVETGKRFKVKWSPPKDMKLLSNNRYCSPRQANKSAIQRKNKALTRHRISKSLNFETGRNDRFKTPSSGGLDQFSRSAKIMRALSFNSCPGNNSKRKNVTKVLNFDMSPKSVQSPASNFSTSSPIDSIHLSISSSDSHATSIDENQNRTPSHPRKSAKKSLDYLTPKSDRSVNSPGVNISPVLRSGRREKIRSLIEMNETPNVHSIRRNLSKSAVPNDIVNTSRNLYYDFERECSDSSPCPSTPKNTSKPVPESMSAIKKSHRKERLFKRFHDKERHEKMLDVDDDDDGMRLLEPEDLPISPQFTQHSTPNNRVNLINKSINTEDNSDYEDSISETGSLFSYSLNKENIDEQEQLPEPDILDIEKEPEINQEQMPNSSISDDQNYLETPKRDKSMLKFFNKNSKINSPQKIIQSGSVPVSSTPLMSRKNFIALTPENDPRVIPDIISSSIKKSHRKVKEENRKRFIKPTALHTALLNSSRDLRHRTVINEQINMHKRVEIAEQVEDRPTTPENLNSSRLLLPQFESVKRSHKKEKHTKKLQGYARRSMLLDIDHLSTSVKSNLSNVSMSLKNLLDDSTSSQSSNLEKKSDSFSGILPIEDNDETAFSPSKKMKTPEGEAVIERSVERKDDFQIFTPLRKRRTHLIMADEPTRANNSITETIDDSFVTPVKGKKAIPQIAIEDVTPEDRLNTTELTKNIEHSIKRSHRKDKLAAREKMTRLNRSLNTSFIESMKQTELDNPKPSTSKASDDTTPAITPPNCLKTKTYLNLLQNSSIKKLHKSEREKRRSLAEINRSINETNIMLGKEYKMEELQNLEDSHLSDDGSIFSEEERISFLEAEGAINENVGKMDIESINQDVNENINSETVNPLNNKDKCSDLNQSYQGSIFDDSDRLQSMDEEIKGKYDHPNIKYSIKKKLPHK